MPRGARGNPTWTRQELADPRAREKLDSMSGALHSFVQSASEEPAMPVETVIAQARDFLGERLSTNATLREQHSHGEDTQPPVLPDAVAFIETTEEAARLLT